MTDTLMTHSPTANIGPKQQWATRFAFLCSGIAMATWAPLVPFAQERIGASEAELGLLLLCLGLGSIMSMPVSGALAGRFGCRKVIVSGATVLAIVLPSLAWLNNGPLLAVALTLFGANVGALNVTMNVQAVIVENASRRSMMSGFHGLFSVGGIIGAGGTSLLLGTGLSPVQATTIIAMLIVGLIASSFGGLLPSGGENHGRGGPFAWPRGVVLVLGALCFIVFLGEGAVLDWSAIFLISAKAADPAAAGFGYTVFAIAMTFGRLTGDRGVQALGNGVIIALGAILAASGFLLTVYTNGISASMLGFGLIGLGAANMAPVFFTMAGKQKSVPASMAVAAISTIGYSGILMGPAAIGFIAQRTDIGTAFILIACALMVVAAIGPLAAPSQRHSA